MDKTTNRSQSFNRDYRIQPATQAGPSMIDSAVPPKVLTKLENAGFESSLRQKILCVDEHQCKSVDRNQEIAVPGLLFCAAIVAVDDNKVAAAHWMPPLDYDSDSDSDSDDGKSLSQLKQELIDKLGNQDGIDFYCVFRSS